MQVEALPLRSAPNKRAAVTSTVGPLAAGLSPVSRSSNHATGQKVPSRRSAKSADARRRRRILRGSFRRIATSASYDATTRLGEGATRHGAYWRQLLCAAACFQAGSQLVRKRIDTFNSAALRKLGEPLAYRGATFVAADIIGHRREVIGNCDRCYRRIQHGPVHMHKYSIRGIVPQGDQSQDVSGAVRDVESA